MALHRHISNFAAQHRACTGPGSRAQLGRIYLGEQKPLVVTDKGSVKARRRRPAVLDVLTRAGDRLGPL